MLKNLYNKKIQQASASCKKGRTLTHKKKNLFCSLSNRGVVRAIVNGHQQGWPDLDYPYISIHH